MEHDDIPDDWHETTLDEWKEKLKKLGFLDAEIAYSGFCSQGDGASFTAEIGDKRVRLPRSIKRKMRRAYAVQRVLHRMNEPAERPPEELTLEVCAKIERTDSRYVHAYTIGCKLQTFFYGDFPAELEQEICDWFDAQEKALIEEARDLSDEIYRELEKEYYGWLDCESEAAA